MKVIVPSLTRTRRLALVLSTLLPVCFASWRPLLAMEPAAVDGNRSLTLQECVEAALRNQPAIAAQRAAVGMAVEQKRIAKSYFLPQVTLFSRLTHTDEPRSVDINSPINGATADVFSDAAAFFGIARQAGSLAANASLNNPTQPPFSTAKQAALAGLPATFKVDLLGETFLTNQILLVQPLYTGGKIRYRNEQAKLGIWAADADVNKSEQQTAFEVTRAYLSVQLASELQQIAGDTTEQFLAIETLAESHLEQGTKYVTKADSTRAKSLRLLAESETIGVERAADLARAALCQAMGTDPAADIVVAETKLRVNETTLDLDSALATAYEKRPELRKAELAINNAGLEKKLADAQFHPDVALFGSFSTINDNRNYPNPNDPDEWAAGVGLELPLFTGGRRTAQRRYADQRRNQATHWREAARNAVAMEVKQAYLEYREAAQRLPLAKQAADEAEQSLERYRDQLITGLDDKDMPQHFRDRQTAQLLLTQAQVRYMQAIFGYNVALARMRLAMGEQIAGISGP